MIGAAALFGCGIWYFDGAEKGTQFFAGYLLEQSLSVDNLFVFILVFDLFKTDSAGQEKVRAFQSIQILVHTQPCTSMLQHTVCTASARHAQAASAV